MIRSTSSDGKSEGSDSEVSDKSFKRQPILIRQSIQPTEIMDRLNLNRVRRMQKLWQGNPNRGLKIEEFVKVIVTELHHQPSEKFELI